MTIASARSLTAIQSSRRLQSISKHLSSVPARHMASSASMAKIDIDSKTRLNSGYDLPLLGYGVYQTPNHVASSVVSHALKTGYRHVDSAAVYRNEAECASAIQQSGIPRESVFFTTKVPPKDISYEAAKKSVETSLQKCKGLGYLDLVLLHAPYGGKAGRLGAWDALTEAVASGKVRSIGVSNYGVHHLDELEAHMKEKEAKTKGSGGVLSVNQVELHPWLARSDIVSWCRSRGVVMQAYSPLYRGNRWGESIVKTIAEKYKKTEAQVLLRWSLQMGFVPLPKSVTPQRIEENTQLYDFELSDEDMKTLDTRAYEPSAWDPTVDKD